MNKIIGLFLILVVATACGKKGDEPLQAYDPGPCKCEPPPPPVISMEKIRADWNELRNKENQLSEFGLVLVQTSTEVEGEFEYHYDQEAMDEFVENSEDQKDAVESQGDALLDFEMAIQFMINQYVYNEYLVEKEDGSGEIEPYTLSEKQINNLKMKRDVTEKMAIILLGDE